MMTNVKVMTKGHNTSSLHLLNWQDFYVAMDLQQQ